MVVHSSLFIPYWHYDGNINACSIFIAKTNRWIQDHDINKWCSICHVYLHLKSCCSDFVGSAIVRRGFHLDSLVIYGLPGLNATSGSCSFLGNHLIRGFPWFLGGIESLSNGVPRCMDMWLHDMEKCVVSYFYIVHVIKRWDDRFTSSKQQKQLLLPGYQNLTKCTIFSGFFGL